MNSGDVTRSTFRPYKHYSGVRMQQGRVQLDADWNEQLDLTAYRDRLEAHDVIGAVGVPKADGGFDVMVSPDGQDLLLSPGRAWIGGKLCEVDGETTLVEDEPTTTSVTVVSLVLDGAEIQPDEWVEVLSGTDSRVGRVEAVEVATRTITLDVSVGPLSGDLRLRRRTSYAYQPDLPDPQHTSRASATDPLVLDLPNGTYLACLGVWERGVTSLDDPGISEPALGVATATRSKVVWQLQLLDLAGVPQPVDCDTDLTTVLAPLAPSTGRMAARAEPSAGSEDLCRPTPAGGYAGLDNQLYRVHVHELDGNRPVIVWSRENASVATTWVGTITSDVLEVAGIGRDAVLGFQPGDWVELYDDTCVLNGRPGTLVRLLNAKEDRLTLDLGTATGSTDIAGFPVNPQVRRWDSQGPLTVTGEDWVELELGVQVRFPAEGTYRRHDYWLVPARSVIADVDWPRDSGGDPLGLLPAGIRRDVGKLAIVTRSAEGLAVTDCRDRFPSLTTLAASDVTVGNETCNLPGVETVQDAIDVLCRSHDLRRHNRLLHGYGIVCGLAIHCGDETETGEVRTSRNTDFTTDDRRSAFRSGDVDSTELREEMVRRFVTVEPGSAIDTDGFDLELPEPVVVDVLDEIAALGDDVLDEDGDGEVCLVLRTDLDLGPVVSATKYVPRESWSFLEGTLIHDIYNDCLATLFRWVKAQVTPPKSGDPSDAYLLRTSLTNLVTYVANPKSGGNVFVSENEHDQLVTFYEGLRKRLRSQTFCAMFDDARPYPDYPSSLLGIRTIAGSGMHSRARMHPGGREVWTTGGGLNPLKPTTMINRYSLDRETLVARIDPVSGNELEHGDNGSNAAAAVTDVAFSPDGKLIYVAVPTRDGNDTLFRVGEIGDSGVKWRPATTICGVKLVTLATTEADPDHVYAAGIRRTSTEGKAFSLREFTGAGIWRIPSREVPDGLGPIEATAALNSVGHLAISPGGEVVFTCGPPGGTAERYDRIVSMDVAGNGVQQMPLDGSGSDDLTLVLGSDGAKETTAWVVVGSGGGRQVAGFDIRSGDQRARVPVSASGRLCLQAVNDRILVTDSNSSVAQLLDTSRHEFLDQLTIPVQVAPMSATATSQKTRHVVVLNLVSNSLTAIDAEVLMREEFDLGPLVEYRRAAVEAFADLVGGLAQYVKDCVCDHLLVKCPPTPVNKDLELAAVSIRGGSVYKVCNFSRRRYVKSFPTVGYWMSLVPVLPVLREAIGRACCALLPDYFGLYSTTGHDDADDRVDAGRVLSFLELVQGEDPMTRLKNLDLGFLPSFFKGANEGDWGESSRPSATAPAPGTGTSGGIKVIDEARPEVGEPVVAKPDDEPIPQPREEIKPSAPEILFGNILRNPAIRRDISREIASEELAIKRAEGLGAEGFAGDTAAADRTAAGSAGRLDELLARVESLEAELAAIKEAPAERKSTSRARKAPAEPKEE